jgi:hypothetical protein
LIALGPRRSLAALTLALGLVAVACDGGDSSPDAPAQDAGTQDGDQIGPGGDDGGGTLGEDGVEEPAPGANLPQTDPGDDLEEPTP